MIRLFILCLVIALIIYMFRHHEKVAENMRWIIGAYVIIALILIVYAVKSELGDGKQIPVSSRAETVQIVQDRTVTGDAPVRQVNTRKPIRYTRGALPLEEFLSSSCPVVDSPMADSVLVTPHSNVSVKVKGYRDIDNSREELAKAIWYLYEIHERLLDIEMLPALDIKLHVYSELVSYERTRQQTVLALPHDDTGFSLESDHLAVTYVQRSPEKTMKAALHQSYHVMAHALYGETLPWFTEGMAAYFETLMIGKNELSLPENRTWVPMMTGSYSKFNINSIPLRELLTMSSRIFYNGKKDLNFAASHSFVSFMMNHDIKGAQLMRRYMQVLVETQCERPEPAAEFFERFYPGGLEALEKRWSEHAIPGNDKRVFRLDSEK